MLDRLIGERYRQHRYRVGYRDGMAEVRQMLAEVLQEKDEDQQASSEAQQTAAEIRQATRQALAEAQRRLDEWNNRRLAAEAAGEPFTEPPPSVYSPNGKDGRAAGNAPGGQAVE